LGKNSSVSNLQSLKSSRNLSNSNWRKKRTGKGFCC